MFVDRTHSGRYSNTTAQGGPIPLPPGGLLDAPLALRLFVDRSLLEVPRSARSLLPPINLSKC